MSIDFRAAMEPVARALLGEPNDRLSTRNKELRFGAKGSLSVDLVKGVFRDFETGEGGGVLDLVAAVLGLRGGDAVAWLRREGLVDDVRETAAAKVDRSAHALRLWRAAEPAPSTLVEAYLRARKICLPVPPSLRFAPSLYHASQTRWPAMVALVQRGVDGAPVAVHRTWLRPDGAGKAPVGEPKMALGPTRGGAVRLAAVGSTLMVGEGVETCLSAMQATGLPAWAALGTEGLRKLDLPEAVREVVVLADGDEPGERAAVAAGERWCSEGRRTRIARPPPGKDFNDMLVEAARP
jgi:hypothetical protein